MPFNLTASSLKSDTIAQAFLRNYIFPQKYCLECPQIKMSNSSYTTLMFTKSLMTQNIIQNNLPPK